MFQYIKLLIFINNLMIRAKRHIPNIFTLLIIDI